MLEELHTGIRSQLELQRQVENHREVDDAVEARHGRDLNLSDAKMFQRGQRLPLDLLRLEESEIGPSGDPREE